jgi:hypothetical protein
MGYPRGWVTHVVGSPRGWVPHVVGFPTWLGYPRGGAALLFSCNFALIANKMYANICMCVVCVVHTCSQPNTCFNPGNKRGATFGIWNYCVEETVPTFPDAPQRVCLDYDTDITVTGTTVAKTGSERFRKCTQ